MNLKTALRPLPFMVLLFILPFPGTVVLRLACLAAAFLIVVISWRRLSPPPSRPVASLAGPSEPPLTPAPTPAPYRPPATPDRNAPIATHVPD